MQQWGGEWEIAAHKIGKPCGMFIGRGELKKATSVALSKIHWKYRLGLPHVPKETSLKRLMTITLLPKIRVMLKTAT